MSEPTHDPLHERLQGWIGKSLNPNGPFEGPDPVNPAMIHNWIDAFDDRNPVYEDRSLAGSSRFGQLVAPFAMMQTWTMARPRLEGIAERGGAAVELDPNGPLTALNQAGYTGTLATNSELEFERPLHIGDVITVDTRLESISPRKTTGLGPGYFVTWISTYTDQHDQVVGRQLFRILKFNPHAPGGAA